MHTKTKRRKKSKFRKFNLQQYKKYNKKLSVIFMVDGPEGEVFARVNLTAYLFYKNLKEVANELGVGNNLNKKVLVNVLLYLFYMDVLKKLDSTTEEYYNINNAVDQLLQKLGRN